MADPTTGVVPPNSGDTSSADLAALPSVRGYELLQVLGRGGMGTVYKARQLALKRVVALKVLRDPANLEALNRFRAEAEAAARLSHPSIVQLFEVGESDGLPYFSQEFIEGGTLSELLARRTQSPHEAAEMMQTVARAMHFAHESNVVHRDLKPSNILLSKSCAPKVADFGLAKQLDSDSALTRAGAIFGTPSYMAPEQARGELALHGPRVDIFALGCILYEQLTGRVAFRGASISETIHLICETDPIPPRRFQPNIPRDLETITLKCLEKRPADRYQSAESLAADLARFLAGETISARRAGLFEQVVKWCWKRPFHAAAMFLVAAACGLGIWLYVEQYRRSLLQVSLEQSDRARQREKELRQDREAALEVAAQNAYFYRISMASRAWEEANPVRTRQLLEECPDSLRGWEWNYLQQQTQSALQTWKAHEGSIDELTLSPNGRWLLTRGNSGNHTKLWHTATGELAKEFRPGVDPSFQLALLADNQLATIARPSSIAILSLPDLKVQSTHSVAPSEIIDLGSTQGGKKLVLQLAGTTGTRFAIWDLASAKIENEFAPSTEVISNLSAAVRADRFSFVTSTQSSPTLRVWQSTPPQELLTVPGYAPISARLVGFSADGERLVCGLTQSNDFIVWNLMTGEAVSRLTGHSAFAYGGEFSPVAPLVATCSRDRTIRLWHAPSGRPLHVYRGHTASVHEVRFSPDGRRLYSASRDGTVRVWDAEHDPSGIHVVPCNSPLTSVAAAREMIAVGSLAGQVRFANGTSAFANGKSEILIQEGAAIVALAFDPTGEKLAVLKNDDVIQVWDIPQRRLRLEKPWNLASKMSINDANTRQYPFRGVSFTKDGKTLAIAGGSTELGFLDLASGEIKATFAGNGGVLWNLAFSPDGQQIATGSGNDILIFDRRSGEIVRTLSLHTDAIWGVSWSGDGQSIAAASQDQTISLWNPATGKLSHQLGGHTGPVMFAEFSPDSRRLFTGAGDQTIRVYDVASGQECLSLNGHNDYIHAAAFCHDGRTLLTTSNDGSLRIWFARRADNVLTNSP